MSFHRSSSTSGVRTPDSSPSILQKIETLVSSGELTGQNNNRVSDLAADIKEILQEYSKRKMTFIESNRVLSSSDRKKLVDAVNKLTPTNPTTATKIVEVVKSRLAQIGKFQFDGTGDKNTNDNYLTIRDVLQKYYARSRIADVLNQVKLTEEERWSLFENQLKVEERWSLFEKQLKGEESWSQLEKHPKLLEIGKQIAEKCEGVRLVVERVAKGLAAHRDQSDWELVRDNFAECLKVLLYDEYLPDYLKPCFSYCCLFPEDHQIDVQTLITMWMALDKIKRKERDSREPEEIGTEYVEELVNKGLLISESKDVTGTTVTACKMHPLIRQLAIHVAPDHRISPHIHATGDDFVKQVANVPKEVGHVSFTLGPDALLHHSVSPSQIPKDLFTLLIFSTAETSNSTTRVDDRVKKGFSTNLNNFISLCTTLRVLGLNNMGMDLDLLPNSITECKELVYLDISKNRMTKLPDDITKLSKLQTLKLSHCHLLKELPTEISKLSNSLRHLIIDGCSNISCMPPEFQKLVHLRTLSRFVVTIPPKSSDESNKDKKTGGLKELENLNNLRGNLEIAYLDTLIDQAASEAQDAKIKDKTNLGGLTISWLESENDNDGSNHRSSLAGLEPNPEIKELGLRGYCGMEFPIWISSSHLHRLVKLTLFNCPKCKHLRPLDDLSSLKFLHLLRLQALESIPYEKEETCLQASIFVSLEELTIRNCPKLKGWTPRSSTKQVPIIFGHCFSLLRVQNCPLLTEMPLFSNLKNKLILINANLEPLKQTTQMMTSTSTSASSQQQPLSELKHLHLGRVGDDKKEPLLDRWLTNLTCLKSLRTLVLSEISDLVSLPHELLENKEELLHLQLFNLPKLERLPQSIKQLRSLERMVIFKCHGLEFLPSEMRDLTSLKTLVIEDCPNLLVRCQRDTGEDWPKILHIPNISHKSTSQDFYID